MWLMTQMGFFSIVKKGGKNTWTIRSRCKKDMDNLKEFASLKGNVIITSKSDYHYRILISGKELQTLFEKLPDSIEYPNFKQMIHAHPEQAEKYPFYRGCWETMWMYQLLKERNGLKKFELHAEPEYDVM
jgi:hypothetical protein